MSAASMCNVENRIFLLLLAGLVFLLPAGASTAQDDSSGHSDLRFSNWQASAYSHRAGGTVCWLAGEDGSLRVEVRRGSALFTPSPSPESNSTPAALDLLLERSGVGWTLVLGPDDSGTFNAWGEEWRQPPGGLASLVRLLASAVELYPGMPPSFDFAVPIPQKQSVSSIPRPAVIPAPGDSRSQPPVWRYQMDNLQPAKDGPVLTQGFRARMAARGRGAGGDREVVTLVRYDVANGSESGLRARSSRRPGTLEVQGIGNLLVPTPPAEIFLPLWPMAQFF